MNNILTAFNDHFIEFVSDIQNVFPNDPDILATKNILVAVRKANPKMIVKIWNSYVVGKYKPEIEAGNIEFFINKDLIPKYKDGYEVALIFDGLQLRTKDIINDDILKECRIFSMDKTGYDIELKIKPFDSLLEVPDNLDIDYDNDLLELIDKYSLGLKKFL